MKKKLYLLLLSLSISCFLQGQTTINVTQQNGEHLTLPYAQNDLTLKYVGIHFDDAEKTTYQYKMEGVHEDWQLVGTERTVDDSVTRKEEGTGIGLDSTTDF